MNEPTEVRAKVREVLAMRSNRRFTEQMLLAGMSKLLPDRVTVAELRIAIEWNQAKGFVDYRHNGDTELDEWFLTEAGKTKEGL